MLRQGPAGRFDRSADLLLRMHFLQPLRGGGARRTVPELRRRTRPPADQTGGETGQIPSLDNKQGPSARVRQGGFRAVSNPTAPRAPPRRRCPPAPPAPSL